jgi:iron complex outermembrane recepter protein
MQRRLFGESIPILAVVCLLMVMSSLTQAADFNARHRFSIPAQPLSAALLTFSAQSGIQIMTASADLRDLTSSAISGEKTTKDALGELLVNTGMRFQVISSNAVAIEPINPRDPKQSGASVGEGQADVRVAQARIDANPTSDSNQTGERSAAGGASSSVSPESANPRLEEIIVTAQKRQERLQDVPISISVLSGKDLDASPFQGATDALNLIPSVVATPEAGLGGTTLLNVRGIGAAGANFSGASPVAYYLDSVAFGFVKSAFVPDPNVYDLQQIEVLRGPQGTLYGANAENGVIRVITNDANLTDFQLKGRVLVSTTEYGGNNYGGDMAINVPIVDGKLAVRGVVDFQDFSGWINNAVADHVNDAELRNYRVKVNAQPTDDLSMVLSSWRSRDSYGAPDWATAERQTLAVIPEPINVESEIDAIKVNYRSPYFIVSSTTSYYHYSNASFLDLGIYGFLSGTPSPTKFINNTVSEEMILSSLPESAWRWTAGAMYRDSTDKQLQSVPNIITLDYGYGSKSYAAFGEIGRRFHEDQFQWTLGLRNFHDDVSEDQLVPTAPGGAVPSVKGVSFNPTTPRAVLTWYPSRDVTVYSSFSEGFRSGFPQDPGVLQVLPGFPAVKPDKLYNYEIGAKTNLWDNRLSFDAALYYIDWRDVQQSVGVPLTTGLYEAALVNGPSASGLGIDWSMTVRPSDALQLSIYFTWNDVTMDGNVMSNGAILFAKGDRLAYSPQFTGGASTAYMFPFGSTGYKGEFSAAANYHSNEGASAFIAATSTYQTAYSNSEVMARTAFSLISPHRWTANLFVENLTNWNGLPLPLAPGSAPDNSPRVRPRTIGVQVDYKL